MSLEIQSKGGESFNAGFWGPDTTRVMLGGLPTMSLKQFCDYATQAIVGCAPELAPEQRQNCSGWVKWVRQDALEKTPVRTTGTFRTGFEEVGTLLTEMEQAEDPQTKAETIEALAMANSIRLGNISEVYDENPFLFRDDAISIGESYEVDPVEFVVFTTQCLHGGLFGWDEELGVPECVVAAVNQLETALAEKAYFE